ncbi:MAG: hypothetical protein KF777_21355 [Planctomycetaceae bacterium]|nr:hypothetical protein [Planctomycetaceae bacterium]
MNSPLTIAPAVHRYRTNLNCGKCVAKVATFLDDEPAIEEWSVDTNDSRKVLTVVGDNASRERVADLVSRGGFQVYEAIDGAEPAQPPRSFLATYRPLLLIVGYLLGITAIIELTAARFDAERAMTNFMGGFFLAFSFFKMLDVRAFATAYRTYDVLASRWPAYGLVYPFLELLLGVAYLSGVAPIATNIATLVLMLIGLVGVSEALLNRRRIQCACLGTVFELPMSKVTFIEDAAMAAMAAFMLLRHVA